MIGVVGTATWGEVLFTLPALVGLLVCLWTLSQAHMIFQARKRSGKNGVLLLIAGNHLLRASLKSFVHLLFVIVGVFSLFIPNLPGESAGFVSLVYGFLFIAAQFLLTIVSVHDMHMRRKLFLLRDVAYDLPAHTVAPEVQVDEERLVREDDHADRSD